MLTNWLSQNHFKFIAAMRMHLALSPAPNLAYNNAEA
jgi:hypothetical protein